MLFVAPGQLCNCAEPRWGTTLITPLCEHIRSEFAPNPGGVGYKESLGSIVAKPTILLLSQGFPPTRSFSYGRVCANKVEWRQNFPP